MAILGAMPIGCACTSVSVSRVTGIPRLRDSALANFVLYPSRERISPIGNNETNWRQLEKTAAMMPPPDVFAADPVDDPRLEPMEARIGTLSGLLMRGVALPPMTRQLLGDRSKRPQLAQRALVLGTHHKTGELSQHPQLKIRFWAGASQTCWRVGGDLAGLTLAEAVAQAELADLKDSEGWLSTAAQADWHRRKDTFRDSLQKILRFEAAAAPVPDAATPPDLYPLAAPVTADGEVRTLATAVGPRTPERSGNKGRAMPDSWGTSTEERERQGGGHAGPAAARGNQGDATASTADPTADPQGPPLPAWAAAADSPPASSRSSGGSAVRSLFSERLPDEVADHVIGNATRPEPVRLPEWGKPGDFFCEPCA